MNLLIWLPAVFFLGLVSMGVYYLFKEGSEMGTINVP